MDGIEEVMKNDKYYFDIGYVLEKLYESEINAAIWWNWDGGIEVRIGNGTYNDEKNWERSDNVKDISLAAKWLKIQALDMYPNSVFASKHWN